MQTDVLGTSHGPMPVVLADLDEAYGQDMRQALQAHPSYGLALVAHVSAPDALADTCRAHRPVALLLADDFVPDPLSLLPSLQPLCGKIIILVKNLNNPRLSAWRQAGADLLHKFGLVSSLAEAVLCLPESVQPRPRTMPNKPVSPNTPGIVAVYSPKGGVGKTNVAMNLAILYSSRGLRTILVDFAQFGSIAPLLKIPQRGKGLSGVITILEQEPEILDSARFYDYLHPAAVSYPYRGGELPILLAAAPTKMDQITAAQAEGILNSLVQAGYQQIVIDCSSELSERNVGVFRAASRILLVMAPDIACGWDLLQMRDLLSSMLIPPERVAVVINRARRDVGFHMEEFKELLGLPVAGVLPDYYKQVQELANRGYPAVFQGFSPLARAYKRLANSVRPVFSNAELRRRWVWPLSRSSKRTRHQP